MGFVEFGKSMNDLEARLKAIREDVLNKNAEEKKTISGLKISMWLTFILTIIPIPIVTWCWWFSIVWKTLFNQ